MSPLLKFLIAMMMLRQFSRLFKAKKSVSLRLPQGSVENRGAAQQSDAATRLRPQPAGVARPVVKNVALAGAHPKLVIIAVFNFD
jgi:hypothetical protein